MDSIQARALFIFLLVLMCSGGCALTNHEQRIINRSIFGDVGPATPYVLSTGMNAAFQTDETTTQAENETEDEESLTDDEVEELAKKAQNPIANMYSLPLQNNTNFGIGHHDRTQNILNIQPVLPFELSEDWLLITRTIVPVIYQPNIYSNSTDSLKELYNRLKDMSWQSKLWKEEWRDFSILKAENNQIHLDEDLAKYIVKELSKQKDLETVVDLQEAYDKMVGEDGKM